MEVNNKITKLQALLLLFYKLYHKLSLQILTICFQPYFGILSFSIKMSKMSALH